MRALFNFKGDHKPNLSGKVMLAIDRGYTRIAILAWWLKTGGDVLRTVMRGVGFVPFTFGKEGTVLIHTTLIDGALLLVRKTTMRHPLLQ